ncbi:MAG: aminotransferase class V-fold PLP-dependent enzyme [Clostridia bacterium]|nr:aminotransferase class V-fold PLP-dependent enzyme [Clostridia bacterium]
MIRTIYLDNAATSFPKPQSVEKAAARCMAGYCVNAGRSSHRLSRMADEKIFTAREELCSLFGINTPEQISFTYNTTYALNIGMKGVLKRGDHLIISSMEHNSVLRPAVSLSSAGVELSIAQADKNGEIVWKNIAPLIKPNTKMVALIHASNVTGRVNNIREIGLNLRKKGIIFLVDAAQSAGIVPINVKYDFIDILCFPGHKGLLGPSGTGGIYVSEKVNIKPYIQGGTGSMSESRFQPDFMPDMLESGTPNVCGIAALSEGVKFVRNNIKEIAEHESTLADELAEKLATLKGVRLLGRGGGKNTGIVGIALDGIPPAEAAYYLDRDYGIATRAGFHCSSLAAKTLETEKDGSLRFSFGPFNKRQDVEKASVAMMNILSR